MYKRQNLHCHTVVSDGDLTPEQVKEAYMGQGYSIVAFTDHNKYCKHEAVSYTDLDVYKRQALGMEGPVISASIMAV